MAVVCALAIIGCYAIHGADHAQSIASMPPHISQTPLAYCDLPRMTVSLGGSDSKTAPRIRLDIALEVASKDVLTIDSVQSRIADRLAAFLGQLSLKQIERPGSVAWLRDQMLKQVNSAGLPVPVHDLMFRQLVIL